MSWMPIGESNMSPRALAILAPADLIAREDARRIAPLLAAHAMRTSTLSSSSVIRSAASPTL